MKSFVAKIYALTDYEDQVFYIGCTTHSLNKRLIGHKASATAHGSWSNSLKCQKIRSLNFRIRIKELQSVNVSATNRCKAQRSAEHLEEKWIKAYASLGMDLCNCSFTDKKTIRGNSKDKMMSGWVPNIKETFSEIG